MSHSFIHIDVSLLMDQPTHHLLYSTQGRWTGKCHYFCVNTTNTHTHKRLCSETLILPWLSLSITVILIPIDFHCQSLWLRVLPEGGGMLYTTCVTIYRLDFGPGPVRSDQGNLNNASLKQLIWLNDSDDAWVRFPFRSLSNVFAGTPEKWLEELLPVDERVHTNIDHRSQKTHMASGDSLPCVYFCFLSRQCSLPLMLHVGKEEWGVEPLICLERLNARCSKRLGVKEKRFSTCVSGYTLLSN